MGNLRLPSLNLVAAIGRLTADAQVKTLAGGTVVANFSVAVPNRRKDPNGTWTDDPAFVKVAAFGKTAEMLRDRGKKGAAVHIEGRMRTEAWTAKDGTKRSQLSVSAGKVSILDKLEKAGRQESGDAEADSVDWPE